MNETKKIEDIDVYRGYHVKRATYSRCDACKRYFKNAYEIIPNHRLHNFDTFTLCKHCIDKVDLYFDTPDNSIQLYLEEDNNDNKKTD